MLFSEIMNEFKNGKKIKLSHWKGYWIYDKNSDRVLLHCKDGRTLELTGTDDILYTISNILSDEWEVVSDEYRINENNLCMMFGEALRYLRKGRRLTRQSWNDIEKVVVYQKGYPEGIPCNKQTACVWGINEGDLFSCNPYLQIQNSDGSHSMWNPNNDDILADDWIVVE